MATPLGIHYTTLMNRPNILWIMSDQHHAEAWGRFRPEVKTPHLDALAKESAVFTRAYCNSPICGPSRVCFITGQYPHHHQILGNDIFEWEGKNPDTVSALFRKNGYQTALIGKAHMVKAWDQEGFEYLRYCDLCDTDRDDPLGCHYFKYLVDQGLADHFDLGTLPPGHPGANMRAFVSSIPEKHSVEHWTGDETLTFLKARDPKRPFFLQMSFQRPHEPLTIPSDSPLGYDPESLPLPKSADDLFKNHFASHHPSMQRHAEQRGGYPYRPEDPADLKRQLAHYYALITAIDTQIGRVLEALKKSGDYENTVVVYHSDHGDFAGDHGLMLKNMGLFESIHRIPFILKFPGGPKDREFSGMIESVDLYPTLAELAGLAVPEGVDGKSFVPMIRDGLPGKESVYCELDFNPARYPERVNAVRTENHRLVVFGDSEGEELFDHRQDPGECDNRAGDPNYLKVRCELQTKIIRHITRYRSKTDFRRDARLHEKNKMAPSILLHKGGLLYSKLAGLKSQGLSGTPS